MRFSKYLSERKIYRKKLMLYSSVGYVLFDPQTHFVEVQRFNPKGRPSYKRGFISGNNRLLSLADSIAKVRQRQYVLGLWPVRCNEGGHPQTQTKRSRPRRLHDSGPQPVVRAWVRAGFGPGSNDSNKTWYRAFRAISGHSFFAKKSYS
jgi:hypothetical protein